MTDRHRLRERRRSFDLVPKLYDLRRPPLPVEALDELARLARLRRGSRVLEIGCATGRLTVGLAQRGYRVTAVELGPDLAAFAASKFAPFPDVEVVTADFDVWEGPASAFDLVVSSDAWHWLDPDNRTRRAAALLRPGGSLAILAGLHVAGGSSEFFAEVQSCYERHATGPEPRHQLRTTAAIPDWTWDLEGSGFFHQPHCRRWVTEASYRTDEYLELLSTFSDHIVMSPSSWQSLADCVARLLDTKHGGAVRRATLTQLCVATTARPDSS